MVCMQCWQWQESEEYRCLESTFRDSAERDWIIITELRHAHSNDNDDGDDELVIVCWLLAPHGYRQNAIYRLTAEQCNSNTRHSISALRPSATLIDYRLVLGPGPTTVLYM